MKLQKLVACKKIKLLFQNKNNNSYIKKVEITISKKTVYGVITQNKQKQIIFIVISENKGKQRNV